MVQYVQGRDTLLKALEKELVGPSPQGKEIDCTQPISFDDIKQSYGPWYQKGSGEEILQRDPPGKRYGVGVLYPLAQPTKNDPINDPILNMFSTPSNDSELEEIITPSAQKSLEQIKERGEKSFNGSETVDVDLPLNDMTRPSSMGISFLADLPLGAVLTVDVSGGRYQKCAISVPGSQYNWWLRSPVKITATFDANDLCTSKEAAIIACKTESKNVEGLDIHVEVFSRPYQSIRKRLITVCLVNRGQGHTSIDQRCLFQSSFKVSISSAENTRHIYPYPNAMDYNSENILVGSDTEEEMLALLYRKAKTFAVGHGCAANWESIDSIEHKKNEPGGLPSVEAVDAVAWVETESLPTFETPSITPNVERHNGTKVEVDMAPLAGLIPGNDGMKALEEVTLLYEEWITQQKHDITTLDTRYHNAAYKQIDECTICLQRMKDGLNYLASTPRAKRAFQLANLAMLHQQMHSGRDLRRYQPQSANFLPIYQEPNLTQNGYGKWRAFQIAFLLMTIHSTTDSETPDRETVELIWFPTGGGKTEAYLGLSAFGIFMRRLESPEDTGVQVLMRYTLRLLTAQQFQRASSLICSMEYIRRNNEKELGKHEFSIGIWLGNATTPNTRKEAVEIWNSLIRNERHVENKFLVNRCPWCHAQMGPIKPEKSARGRSSASSSIPLGYNHQGNTVAFRCPDKSCAFSNALPIYVIDEDIYEKRPTILIGTVDKFALVAWKDEVRSIFGINSLGIRNCSPPNLIIQDELHLISGPLGSMVGLYETLIEELCTDRRHNKYIPPKIVSSTATIRRYREQIQRLYYRNTISLFPPPGLSAADSFFARYATNTKGQLDRGRLYVGVYAPGLGSLQTIQVRSFTALLQAPLTLNEDERDPWWTLLLFFNSLRELGTTLSLFQSDIPDYFNVLANRTGLKPQERRKFWNMLELTGRLQNDEVPEAITKLEKVYNQAEKKDRPVDVCLASNIIEVGVDIDRLSLMTVVGQPKTTSQYIQVTGRVGRQSERPGLIVILYGTTRPRDRSHYEKFRSYHERLYAQVEPTSVTPFSPPVLDRALHAIMVAYVRQLGNKENARSPYPYPGQLLEQLRQIILPRIKAIDPDELPNFTRVFDKRINEWKIWQRVTWDARSSKDIPLIFLAGAYINPDQKPLMWSTANSMRDVDAQCDAIITNLYARTVKDEADD